MVNFNRVVYFLLYIHERVIWGIEITFTIIIGKYIFPKLFLYNNRGYIKTHLINPLVIT